MDLKQEKLFAVKVIHRKCVVPLFVAVVVTEVGVSLVSLEPRS